MVSFPTESVSPSEFIEEVIPQIFAEVELEPDEEAIDLKFGVILGGDEGGDWTLHFIEGELGVARGREEACDLTVIQSVEDFRSALWEGKPALIADGIERIRSSELHELRPPAPTGGGPRPDPLKGISDLRGRIEMVIENAEEADWAIGILIGGGSVPETPQATIRLGGDEAESIRKGDLHPLEALMGGQIQLDGDLGLILQLQAVAMTLGMTAGGGVSR